MYLNVYSELVRCLHGELCNLLGNYNLLAEIFVLRGGIVNTLAFFYPVALGKSRAEVNSGFEIVRILEMDIDEVEDVSEMIYARSK